ncbi:phosphoglycolate phosphatase [Tistlia consotensis]|uniref:Phosphoglycolate phosphatase n=1 Tax=Tistlia consotensis USBA 355 TaxID=560819 RepID=A0A1Y6CC02_9PROT|nr:HAD family hydrolase [Tistlia consotensis]SMF53885.1 phosphoglycolate phosphatase [Tistlia consotensis USBA 355]SNR86189.1 phosphoglycolate phosphatase [Tistlia consotensis]
MTRPAIRGVVFDKDGTLFDYGRTWPPVNRAAAMAAAGGSEAVANRLLALGGHDPETDAVAPGSLMAAGNTREIALAWLPELPHRRVEELVPLLDRVFLEQGIANAAPVTDLPALFDRLAARGLTLAVASNDSEAATAATVGRFGLEARLAFLAGYDSGHGHKPGPGMVQAFCRTTGLEPAAVCVVGDNLHDLEMGRDAGAGLLVGVLTGTGTRAVLDAVAHLVLDSIEQLEAALEDRLAPVD